jgi:hypothetical protein
MQQSITNQTTPPNRNNKGRKQGGAPGPRPGPRESPWTRFSPCQISRMRFPDRPAGDRPRTRGPEQGLALLLAPFFE